MEKKKKKELAREKEEKIKREKEFARDVYRRSLEAEKKVKKEVKKLLINLPNNKEYTLVLLLVDCNMSKLFLIKTVMISRTNIV